MFKFFKRFKTNLGGGAGNKNNRNSAGRRYGPKLQNSCKAIIGNILVTQRGQTYIAGRNVGIGKNDTLFALRNGTVYYERDFVRNKAVVNVDPEPLDRRKIHLTPIINK